MLDLPNQCRSSCLLLLKYRTSIWMITYYEMNQNRSSTYMLLHFQDHLDPIFSPLFTHYCHVTTFMTILHCCITRGLFWNHKSTLMLCGTGAMLLSNSDSVFLCKQGTSDSVIFIKQISIKLLWMNLSCICNINFLCTAN
jgi:hypothetical protein